MEDPKGRQGFPGAQHPPPGYQAGYPAGAPPPAPYGGYPAGAGAAPYYAPGAPAPPADAVTRVVCLLGVLRGSSTRTVCSSRPPCFLWLGPAPATHIAACAPVLPVSMLRAAGSIPFLVLGGARLKSCCHARPALGPLQQPRTAGPVRGFAQMLGAQIWNVNGIAWLFLAHEVSLLASMIRGCCQRWPARSGAAVHGLLELL